MKRFKRILRPVKSRLLRLSAWLMKRYIYFGAKHLKFIYFPLYQWCKHRGILCAINSASAPGHIFFEVDFLFRYLHKEKIPTNKCVVFFYPGDVAKGMKHFYADSFYRIISSRLFFALLMPLPLLFPKISVDIGQSRLKWYLSDPQDRKLGYVPFLYAISQLKEMKSCYDQLNRYYKLRSLTQNQCFMKRSQDPAIAEIKKALKIENETKICLVQIKQNVANATAKVTDPTTYLKALSSLKQAGYCLILVGREKMPACFQELGVINYAQSSYACFKNDIALFHVANLAIHAASGLACLADALAVPFIILNSWHIAIVPFSPLGVIVPAILRGPSGKILSFAEQIDLIDQNTSITDNLDVNCYETIDANQSQIASALEELMQNNSTVNDEQVDLKGKFAKRGLLRYSQCSYSKHFLSEYKQLMDHPLPNRS